MTTREQLTSHAPLHPQAQRVADALGALGRPPPAQSSATEIRAFQQASHATRKPGPDIARVEDRTIPTAGGPLHLRLYAARPDPAAIIVYLHGGGWVMGSVEDSDPHTRRIAEATGCLVVSVDYRLAPEHPFPAALEDAYAALTWGADNRVELAGREVPLILQGDSAGGSVAAATALLARERGGPPVAMQVLGYPPLGLDFETGSYGAYADGPVLSRADMRWFWDQYAPEPAMREDPLAAPLLAPSLAGLPPALIMTGECDPLCDDGERYAHRLSEAGVPTVLKRYEGMPHGFFKMADLLDAGRQAHLDVAAFVRERLA